MRVMVIINGNANSEAGKPPSERALTEMMKFNEELVKAGVMLSGEGLQPTSKSKRIRFSGRTRTSSMALSARRRSSSPASGSGR
jgi:hypothetical protein